MPAIDQFSSFQQTVSAPAGYAEAVTPHNTTELTYVSRALYVGTTGNVTVLTAGGQTVTFTAVPAGALLPIRVARVNSTGTTASNIVSIS